MTSLAASNGWLFLAAAAQKVKEPKAAIKADQAVTGLTSTLTGKVIYLAVVVVVALIIQYFLVKAIRKAFKNTTMSSASIFVNLSKVLIWSLALLAVLQPVFGIQPTAFITAIGVTSLALSLGMQDTISNIMGGLALTLSRIVMPGDTVDVSGISGKVLDVNWRSTAVKDVQGNVQVIPNSVLNKSALTHLAPGTPYNFQLPLTLSSKVDLNQVQEDIASTIRATLSDSLCSPESLQAPRILQEDGMGASADDQATADTQEQPVLEKMDQKLERQKEQDMGLDKLNIRTTTVMRDGPIQITYTGLGSGTISAKVTVYLVENSDISEAMGKVVVALSDKEWLSA